MYDRRAYVLDVDVNDGLYVNDERRKLESDYGNTTPKKGGDKSAVAIVKVCDSWVAYHRTLSCQNLCRFIARAQQFWDQFDEYDSQELRCVKQTSETTKDRCSEKFKSKVLISAVTTP